MELLVLMTFTTRNRTSTRIANNTMIISFLYDMRTNLNYKCNTLKIKYLSTIVTPLSTVCKYISIFFYSFRCVIFHNLLYYRCYFPYTGNRKGVRFVKLILLTLFISITANVLAYYICKWLDRVFKK